jgi:hypothetical protein
MATEAQVCANRSNAPKSTGPRTPAGKAAVAQNAVRHGLLAQEVVIKGEDPEEFELYRDGRLAELAPAGPMEFMLAERIVSLSWRLRRAERLQTAAFDKLEEESKPPVRVLAPEVVEWVLSKAAELNLPDPEPVDEVLAAHRQMVRDFAQTRILDRLLMYERRIEHSLYRTMAELRNLRKERRGEERKEEDEKVRRSEGQAVLPSCAPTFSLSSSVSPLPEEVGWGRPTYEEPPCAVATNMSEVQEPSCETNPMCDRISLERRMFMNTS